MFESLARVRRQNRKRKKRLRKVVMRFQQAAEAMPDGAIVLDADGTILWMNEASDRLLGLDRRRDVGRPVASFVRHPRFTDGLHSGSFEEPIQLTSPNRSELQLLIRMVPYGGSRRLMLVRDVTRIYNLEQMRKDFVANVSHELRSPLTVLVGYLEAIEDDELLPLGVQAPGRADVAAGGAHERDRGGPAAALAAGGDARRRVRRAGCGWPGCSS